MDPAGVEPASPARQASVFPLDHRPLNGDEGNRTHRSLLARQSRPLGTCVPICSRGQAGSRTQTATLPEWCAAVTPQDQQVAEAGIEPASDGL